MTPDNFRAEVSALWERFRSSKHPFFDRLKSSPAAVVHSPMLLEELYKRYQGAMHASRAMAYRMPHLDAIDLRMAKFKVLSDDDGASNGDSHHYQLRRTWSAMLGHPPKLTDDEFGELDQLKKTLDPKTAQFVSLCKELYPRSLGPWIMVEGLAHDWIGAFLKGLSPHFPGLEKSDYFRENYGNRIEIRHAQEALNTTIKVMIIRPELVDETLDGAVSIGKGLNIFWSGMDELLVDALRSESPEAVIPIP